TQIKYHRYLVKWGALSDGLANQPAADLIPLFKTSLISRGNLPKTSQLTVARVSRLLDRLPLVLTSVKPADVLAIIPAEHPTTRRHYVRAFNQFSSFLQEHTGRPIIRVPAPSATVDSPVRPFPGLDLFRLIQTTTAQPRRGKLPSRMTGPHRAVLYRWA